MRQRYPASALGVDAAREAPWVEHLGEGGGRSHADDRDMSEAQLLIASSVNRT